MKIFQDEEDIELRKIFLQMIYFKRYSLFEKNKIDKIKKIHEYLESRNEMEK